jgi:hypothetical protein
MCWPREGKGTVVITSEWLPHLDTELTRVRTSLLLRLLPLTLTVKSDWLGIFLWSQNLAQSLKLHTSHKATVLPFIVIYNFRSKHLSFRYIFDEFAFKMRTEKHVGVQRTVNHNLLCFRATVSFSGKAVWNVFLAVSYATHTNIFNFTF